jgi:hypothetical protein
MGRLTHLLYDEPQPNVTQLDFSERVSSQVALELAQEAVNRLAPYLQNLLEQTQISGTVIKDSADGTNTAIKDARKALEQAIAAESMKMQDSIKKAAKAITAASSADAEAMRDGVVTALSAVQIPDYSDQLGRIEAVQKMAVKAISEIPQPEGSRDYKFTVNRNRNGFIQSVDAEAQ